MVITEELKRKFEQVIDEQAEIGEKAVLMTETDTALAAVQEAVETSQQFLIDLANADTEEDRLAVIDEYGGPIMVARTLGAARVNNTLQLLAEAYKAKNKKVAAKKKGKLTKSALLMAKQKKAKGLAAAKKRGRFA